MKANLLLLIIAVAFLDIQNVKSVEVVLGPVLHLISSARGMITSQVNKLKSELISLSSSGHSSFNAKAEIKKLPEIFGLLLQLVNTVFANVGGMVNILKQDIIHTVSDTDSAISMPVSELSPYANQLSHAEKLRTIIDNGITRFQEIIKNDFTFSDSSQHDDVFLTLNSGAQIFQTMSSVSNAFLELGHVIMVAATHSLNSAAGSIIMTPLGTFMKIVSFNLISLGRSLKDFEKSVQHTVTASGKIDIDLAKTMKGFNNEFIPFSINVLKTFKKALNSLGKADALL